MSDYTEELPKTEELSVTDDDTFPMTDAFYEIEFWRLYSMQGKVLKTIGYRKRQLYYQKDKYAAQRGDGVMGGKAFELVAEAQRRLDEVFAEHNAIEEDKKIVSRNPKYNPGRAADAKIIDTAYEQAYKQTYENVCTASYGAGIMGCLRRLLGVRQK